MKKQALALFLALALCLSLTPALAAESEESTGWTVTEIVPFGKYDYAYSFSEGLAVVKSDGKGWGYIDKTGKEVIPCKHDWANSFSDGLAEVRIGDSETGKYGYIDTTGKEVIPYKYDMAYSFSDGLAKVRIGDLKTGNWAYIDKTGQEVISCKYPYFSSFRDGFAMVAAESDYGHYSQWGCIDKTGTEIIPAQYDDIIWDESDNADGFFSENLMAVKLGYEWGYVDTTGQVVIPCKYDSADFFSEGLAAVELDGKWGYIDTSGNEVIPFQYDNAGGFSEGLATVAFDTGETDEYGDPIFKVGCIDKTGEIAFVCAYEWVGKFSDGLAWVWVKADDMMARGGVPNLMVGLIDKTGREIVPCKYLVSNYEMPEFSEGLAAVQLDGKWGYIDKTGTEVIPCQYSGAESLSGGLALVYVGDWPNAEWSFISIVKEENLQPTPSTTPSSEPSATPSNSPSPSPSTKPSGGGSGGGSRPSGGGGGFAVSQPTPSPPTESPKPTESEKPAQSEKPVETEKPATPASQVFQDVAQGAWYEAGVTYVVDKGLFQGVAQSVFAPNEVMTRAMLMTVLARLDGQDTAGGETWFQKGMDWAVDKAISDGTQPQASVTREQMVTMLYRYAKPAAGLGDLTTFADAGEVSDWAQAAVEWAVSQGVLTGKDGSRLDPQGTATRAEVATILQRFVALRK